MGREMRRYVGLQWTANEEQLAKALKAEGKSYDEMAEIMGRSPKALRERLTRMTPLAINADGEDFLSADVEACAAHLADLERVYQRPRPVDEGRAQP